MIEEKWREYFGPQRVRDLDDETLTALRCCQCPFLVGHGWTHINHHEELKKQGRPIVVNKEGVRFDSYNFWLVNAIRLRDWEREWLLDGTTSEA